MKCRDYASLRADSQTTLVWYNENTMGKAKTASREKTKAKPRAIGIDFSSANESATVHLLLNSNPHNAHPPENNHTLDPNLPQKQKQQGTLNRLTPILLNLSIQHGIPTTIIASTFQLNKRTLHNHLTNHAAPKLRLREEHTLLQNNPNLTPEQHRLQGIRPRLIAAHHNKSESHLRQHLHNTGTEEELRTRQIEQTHQALITAVNQNLLPVGLLR